jgi:hypothetical protein
MNSYSQHYFSFHNYSTSKLPLNIEARYCFESELIKIPYTEAFLEIDPDVWVVFDVFNNIYTFTMDQFADVYMASDKKALKYYEFVIDSANNDYNPNAISGAEELLENILEDYIEKPVKLSFKGRLALVWDLLLNKNIFISKY